MGSHGQHHACMHADHASMCMLLLPGTHAGPNFDDFLTGDDIKERYSVEAPSWKVHSLAPHACRPKPRARALTPTSGLSVVGAHHPHGWTHGMGVAARPTCARVRVCVCVCVCVRACVCVCVCVHAHPP
jgi:hypothetical protein